VTSVFHRHVREGSLTLAQGRELKDVFGGHVESDALPRRAVTLIRGVPKSVPLRAGDAIHLATALDVGEPEIRTNDRHLLAAAAQFGIAGRSV
jgi:predicted nucleic acid-binding protein